MRACLLRALTLALILVAQPSWAQDAPDAGVAADAGAVVAPDTPNAPGPDTPAPEAPAPDAPAPKVAGSGASKGASPKAIAPSSTPAEVARFLGVEPVVLDTADSVAALRDKTATAAAGLEAERKGLIAQIEWTRTLLPAAPAEGPDAGGVDPADVGPPVDAEVPVDAGAVDAVDGGEVAPIVPATPSPIEARITEIEARVAVLNADIKSKRLLLTWLDQHHKDLVATRDTERDARVQEAEATRAEVEKQRTEAAVDTDRAAEELEQIRAEAESSEQSYKDLAAEDIAVRSEQLYLLGRVVEELPVQIQAANRAVTELAAYRKDVDAETTELRRRITDRDKPDDARAAAVRRYDELAQRQAVARDRASTLQELLDFTDAELEVAGNALNAARAEAAVRRDAAGAASEDRVKQKALSVAEARFRRAETRKTVLDLRRRLYALQLSAALDEAAYCKRTRLGVLNLLPPARLSADRAINDQNIKAATVEVQDLILEARQLLHTRAKQFVELPSRAFSLAGIWWFMKAAILLAFLVVGVRRLGERRQELVDALGTRILGFRWWRHRRHQALRLVEVIGASMAPLTTMACVYAALWLFPADAPSVIVLGTVAKASVLYWLVIQILRTVILPKWFRDSGEVPANDTDAAQELDQARFLLATLQLLLTYTVACQATLYFVREGMGLLFVGYWVHVIGYLGYVVVIYLLLTRWRETIATIFAQRVGERSSRAAAFVAEHKDRFYGILVIFGAFLYVAVTVSGRWARRYLEGLGAVTRIRNFLFRRRIEMEQRLDKERAKGTGTSELPADLVGRFEITAPPEPLVERPEFEALKALVAGWHRPGRPGVIHVVGERGMGKTTLLNRLVDEIGDGTRRWSVGDRFDTRDDLVACVSRVFGVEASDMASLTAALLDLPPAVVVVDDTHRIFLRKIGGFDALIQLERLMVATGEHHLWVLSYDSWAWRYLRQRNRRPLTGPAVVTLGQWSALDLRGLVTTKTEAAGLTVSYSRLTDEDGSGTGEARSAGGYFSLLEEASHGNPWCAGDLWLNALTVDQNSAQVGLFSQKAAARLRGVADEGRFLLAALIQHDGLTAGQTAGVLGISESAAQELLLDLVERGLAERRNDGAEHLVTRTAFRETVAFVRGHNLLHT